MYLLEFKSSHSRWNGNSLLKLNRNNGDLKKWTCIDSGNPKKDLELLQLIALAACGCAAYLDRLPCDLSRLPANPDHPLTLELVWTDHLGRARRVFTKQTTLSALTITSDGKTEPLARKDFDGTGRDLPYAQLRSWNHPAKHPVFAYRDKLSAHAGTDDFNFTDPFYQLNRIRSLFSAEADVTDPVAFLSNLNYRAIRCRRYMPAQILDCLQKQIERFLGIDTRQWSLKHADFTALWQKLSRTEKTLLLPVLDAARHLHDALPSFPNPLEFPAVMLFYRPDRLCPPALFPNWINLVDHLFPAMQCIICVPGKTKSRLSKHVLSKKLPAFMDYSHHIPKSMASVPAGRRCKSAAVKMEPNTILLVHVDGRLPNLALMKLSAHYKKKGYRIRLVQNQACEPGAEAVFASAVFNLPGSVRKMERMAAYYDGLLDCGGSGIDVKKRLPREIEDTAPDYDIYPLLQDRCIGFLTRGCPFKCPFCIVPIKEGKPKQVADIDSLTLLGKRKKVILLDDNILAHPDSHQLLEEMVSKKLLVNFNQTLDLSLVDKYSAGLLRKIPCSNVTFSRMVYHFSLNDTRNLPMLRQKYNLFNFTPSDNVEFICMYGYNTTLAQDVERFRFLRTLPGAYVFVQEYQPIAGKPKPDMDHFFSDKKQSDQLIDELIHICFTQNMKSMEKYYRWLCRLYADRFGAVHEGLINTVFRYNMRFKRGRYVAELLNKKTATSRPRENSSL